MNGSVQERRSKPRVSLDSEFVVFSGCEKYWCKSKNVASGGMAFISPVGGMLGSFLRIQFTLPDSQDLLPVDAILVREECKSDGYLWGVCFLDPDARVVGRIEAYVREQLVSQVRSHCANTAKRSASARARLQAAVVERKKAHKPATAPKEKPKDPGGEYAIKSSRKLDSLLDKAVDWTK